MEEMERAKGFEPTRAALQGGAQNKGRGFEGTDLEKMERAKGFEPRA
jgi:hypothetical protein